MEEGEQDHYLFLHAAFAKCETCLTFWLHHGADLSRGTASHPDWIALEWARASNASPEILRLLTPSVWPSLQPRAFCVGVELDMYARVPGRIDRRRICQLIQQSQDHSLSRREIFAKFARELGWIEKRTRLAALLEPLRSAFGWTRRLKGRGVAFHAESFCGG